MASDDRNSYEEERQRKLTVEGNNTFIRKDRRVVCFEIVDCTCWDGKQGLMGSGKDRVSYNLGGE